MLVAILYCFVNKEVRAGAEAAGSWPGGGTCPRAMLRVLGHWQVQAELLKRWQRWKLGKDLAEEYKHTYSHTPQPRGGGSTCEKHRLVSYINGGRGLPTAHTSSHYLERTGASPSPSPSESLTPGQRQLAYDFPGVAESTF